MRHFFIRYILYYTRLVAIPLAHYYRYSLGPSQHKWKGGQSDKKGWLMIYKNREQRLLWIQNAIKSLHYRVLELGLLRRIHGLHVRDDGAEEGEIGIRQIVQQLLRV